MGSALRAIAWVVLLAFTFQSFVTQTHIHGVLGGAGAGIAHALGNGSSHPKTPAQNDSSNCPFCQAIIHAGVFASPSAPSLILPVGFVRVAAPAISEAAGGIVSLPFWQSRAPPQR